MTPSVPPSTPSTPARRRSAVQPPPGRRAGLALVASIVAAAGLDAQSAAPGARSTAGPRVTVLADSFAMPQLRRTRRIRLHLPADYATSGRRYPVLYLHDGQNVFDAATAFAGEWGVDESLDSLQALGHGGVIVVAIDNDGRHRMDEYDPWRARDPRLGGGEGDAYVDFLAATLKPWIDARLRTRPEAASTFVGGSSMGGLISLAAALRRPDVFGGALVFSCACWVARDSILALARAPWTHAAPRPRLVFVVGGDETPDDEPVHDQQRVAGALASAGWRPFVDLHSHIVLDGRHQEWFWRREFPAALRLLLEPAR